MRGPLLHGGFVRIFAAARSADGQMRVCGRLLLVRVVERDGKGNGALEEFVEQDGCWGRVRCRIGARLFIGEFRGQLCMFTLTSRIQNTLLILKHAHSAKGW